MTGTLVRRASRFVYLSDADERVMPTARFGWRLVAANNRPLGRAVHAESSYADCLVSAQRIHDEVDRVETAVSFNATRGHWSWRASLRGEAVAVCVHPYLRRVECERALGQFLVAAGSTSPDEGVIKYFGPNSLRGYDSERAANGLPS